MIGYGQNGGDDQVDRIAADIDQTRGDLANTVRAIGSRLEPGSLAREARDSVQATTRGTMNQMSSGAQDTWRDLRSGNTEGMVEMVRDNPVPTAMIGLGIALLFLNRGAHAHDGGSTLQGRRLDHDREYGGYGDDYSRIGSRGRSPADRVGSMASDARDAVGDAADRASASVSQLSADLPDRAQDMADQAADRAQDMADRAQDMAASGVGRTRRLIDENPLGAGIVALAAGAAIGMLLPETPVERERIGPIRDRAMDRAAEAADSALNSAASAAQSLADATSPKPSDPGSRS